MMALEISAEYLDAQFMAQTQADLEGVSQYVVRHGKKFLVVNGELFMPVHNQKILFVAFPRRRL